MITAAAAAPLTYGRGGTATVSRDPRLAALYGAWDRCRPGGGRFAALIGETRPPYGEDGALSEKILHAAWRRAGGGNVRLKARDGHTYRVLYPGRPGGSLGPDFVDAIIERDDGTRLCGDVEIHVRAADWGRHGHHRDPRYNGVLFNVSLEDGGPSPSASGLRIPLLPIGPALRRDGRITPGVAVAGEDRPAADAAPLTAGGKHASGTETVAAPIQFFDLAAAGDERFANHSSGLALEIESVGADQALYAAALECLGYPRNKGGFRRLAARLPWETLRQLDAQGFESDDLTPLYLWISGFGPRPSGVSLSLRGAAPEWTRPAGRPLNDPLRRVPAAAALADRWLRAGGPAGAFVTAVRQAGVPGEVAAAFIVEAPDGEVVALLGKGRAQEIVVNVLLPGVHALARLRGDDSLAQRCVELYRSHPRLPDNAITREAATLLAAHGIRPQVKGAREQQGLLHLYRAMTSPIARPRQLPLIS